MQDGTSVSEAIRRLSSTGAGIWGPRSLDSAVRLMTASGGPSRMAWQECHGLFSVFVEACIERGLHTRENVGKLSKVMRSAGPDWQ